MQLTSSKTVVLTDRRDIEAIRQARFVEDLLDNALESYEHLAKECEVAWREAKRQRARARFWCGAFWLACSVVLGMGILGGVCYMVIR